MRNEHTVTKTRVLEIESYKIIDGCTDIIEYNIFVELWFSNNKIEKEEYYVTVCDDVVTGDQKIYSGTLAECRKKIKEVVNLYYRDIETEEYTLVDNSHYVH